MVVMEDDTEEERSAELYVSVQAFFSPKMGTNESKSKSNPNFMINLALFGQYSFE